MTNSHARSALSFRERSTLFLVGRTALPALPALLALLALLPPCLLSLVCCLLPLAVADVVNFHQA